MHFTCILINSSLPRERTRGQSKHSQSDGMDGLLVMTVHKADDLGGDGNVPTNMSAVIIASYLLCC